MITVDQVLEELAEQAGGVCRDEVPGEKVRQVEMLTPGLPTFAETLYLRPGEGGRDTECLCRRGEDLVQVGAVAGLEPAEVYGIVRELLEEESCLDEEIGRMYRMLSASGGLRQVVMAAERFLRSPISICDASYNMIEVSPMMQNIEYGISSVHSRLVLDSTEIESLKRLHIEDKIYENQQAFLVDTEDHPDNNWIFCAIRIHNVMAGYVAVCLPVGIKVRKSALRFTTALAGVCAVEMQKHEFFVTRTGMKYENFLVELLEGRFDDVNLISSRLELLDRKFCDFFCIAVLRCSEPHNSSLFNQRQMANLRRVYPNSMSVVYQDAIVLFLNQDEPIRLRDKFTEPLMEFARRNRMKVGLSQPFRDILKIKNYYQQTLNALDMGEVQWPEQILYPAWELLPQYLFSNCPYTGLEVGIHHHIFQLQDHDQRYHTEYVHTLRTYLKCDRNAAQAAQALHLHRSTFFYRIKKMEELLEISMADSGLLFLYELSFRIWDYLSR